MSGALLALPESVVNGADSLLSHLSPAGTISYGWPTNLPVEIWRAKPYSLLWL